MIVGRTGVFLSTKVLTRIVSPLSQQNSVYTTSNFSSFNLSIPVISERCVKPFCLSSPRTDSNPEDFIFTENCLLVISEKVNWPAIDIISFNLSFMELIVDVHLPESIYLIFSVPFVVRFVILPTRRLSSVDFIHQIFKTIYNCLWSGHTASQI